MQVLKVSLFTLAASLSSWAQADFIGLNADVSYWFYDGKVDTTQPTRDQQDFDRDGAAQLSLAFEHPVPFLPNAKIKTVNLKADGKDTADATASSTTELRHTDYILYYEILDNVVSADIGLGLANLDGNTVIKRPTQSAKYDISGNQAIIYAAVGAKLPFTGLSAKGEAVYSNIKDVKLTDVQAEVQYNFVQNLMLDLGAKVGYRYTDLDFNKKNDASISYQFKGPYIGLNAHF